jgi:hypothetical protein
MLSFAEEHLFTEELNWLKYNTQLWTEVLVKLKITSSFRVPLFSKGLESIGAFAIFSNSKVDSLVCICIT